MSDGPVKCPKCNTDFEWSWRLTNYVCLNCQSIWNGRFPILDNLKRRLITSRDLTQKDKPPSF